MILSAAPAIRYVRHGNESFDASEERNFDENG